MQARAARAEETRAFVASQKAAVLLDLSGLLDEGEILQDLARACGAEVSDEVDWAAVRAALGLAEGTPAGMRSAAASSGDGTVVNVPLWHPTDSAALYGGLRRAVLDALPPGDSATVQALLARVRAAGHHAVADQVSNAAAHLVRRGMLRRVNKGTYARPLGRSKAA